MEEDHIHCLSCVNQRCMIRPEQGISCNLIACPLVCGAVFHSCKAEEHQLLCPLVRIPCLNSGYGCPAALTRNQMYAHLEVCPAGVVCCTMEWNRWPVSCLDYTCYESLSRGVDEVEQLDMALALQDQRTLLESLKVMSMAPTAQGGPLFPVDKETVAAHSSSSESSFPSSPSHPPPPPGSDKEKILSGINGLNEEHFSELYEATVETARSLVSALEFISNSGQSGRECACTGVSLQKRQSGESEGLENGFEDVVVAAESSTKNTKMEVNVCSNCVTRNQNVNTTQETMLEGKESCPFQVKGDMGAYVSEDSAKHESTSYMDTCQAVAQTSAHAVRGDQGIVLSGSPRLEIKVHNYPVFRAQNQSSMNNARKSVMPDRSLSRLRPKMEDKSVDTLDLEQDDDPLGLGEIDLITAALLFCLEESRECRRISDTVFVDGYHVDFGTQTFTFPAAILLTNTRVGDIASASACDHAAPQISYPSPFRTLRLGLVLEALEVEAVPHNRYLPSNPRYQHMFPFVCGQSFRRDQFSSHFTNVHGDIHAGLNGWMEHRCPLAYYGCTFSQRRFHPSTPGAMVVHDRHLRSFGVQPCPNVTLQNDSQTDQFSGLPIEILWHIAGFLDSFSLCQFSLVSRTMREVCASLLQTRGIVELQWEQSQCPASNGTVSWHIRNKVWRFSTAFSPVLSWGFTDIPSMSNHLKKCPFYTAEHKTEPVPLPAMCTARDGQSLRRVLRHVST